MSNTANCSSEILHSFMQGIQNCGSSIASLSGKIQAHNKQCIDEAQSILRRLKESERMAEIEYERCRDAYDACRQHQSYDEESGDYQPSCNCEENDMKKAEDEAYKARCARQSAEYHLSHMEYELGNYESPYGGGALIQSISNDYVPNATKRLMDLDEKVSRYETFVQTGVDIGDSSSNVSTLQAPQSNYTKYTKGIEKVHNLEKINKYRKATDKLRIKTAYCNRCRSAPCKCSNIREY